MHIYESCMFRGGMDQALPPDALIVLNVELWECVGRIRS